MMVILDDYWEDLGKLEPLVPPGEPLTDKELEEFWEFLINLETPAVPSCV